MSSLSGDAAAETGADAELLAGREASLSAADAELALAELEGTSVGLKKFLMLFGGSVEAARFLSAALPFDFLTPKPSGSATCVQVCARCHINKACARRHAYATAK